MPSVGLTGRPAEPIGACPHCPLRPLYLLPRLWTLSGHGGAVPVLAGPLPPVSPWGLRCGSQHELTTLASFHGQKPTLCTLWPGTGHVHQRDLTMGPDNCLLIRPGMCPLGTGWWLPGCRRCSGPIGCASIFRQWNALSSEAGRTRVPLLSPPCLSMGGGPLGVEELVLGHHLASAQACPLS